MLVDALFAMVGESFLATRLPQGLAHVLAADESHVDEYVVLGVAIIGVWAQLQEGWQVVSPFDWLYGTLAALKVLFPARCRFSSLHARSSFVRRSSPSCHRASSGRTTAHTPRSKRARSRLSCAIRLTKDVMTRVFTC